MELENLEQIKPEGLHVFMPSGTDATLYKDNDFIIVEYPELYRDKYTKEQFAKLMEEGIQIMNPPSQEVMESKEEMKESLLDKFIRLGYIRPSLAEAYEKAKRKEGDVFKAMNDKDAEYLTADFKNELLTMLDEIAKAYPDVKVRQQATTFIDALGLQEYYGTKAMKDFANKYIKLLHTHVNESINEEDDKFNYMLLARLKQDCEYFLGNGNGYEPHLWAGNVEDQIAKMKELYNKVPEKPEWLSLEDIDNYEKEMLAKRDSKNEEVDPSKLKVKEITKKEWDETPKDYKLEKDGQKYIMYLDDETQATVLGLCKIIDESIDETVDVFDLKSVLGNYECSYVTDLEKDGDLFTAWFIHEKSENGLTGKQIKDATIYYQVADVIERKFGEKAQVITRQYKYAPEQIECLLLLPVTGAKEYNALKPGDKFEMEGYDGVCEVVEKTEDGNWECKAPTVGDGFTYFDLYVEDMDKVKLIQDESLHEELHMTKELATEIINVVNTAIRNHDICDELNVPDMYCDLIADKLGVELEDKQWLDFIKRYGNDLRKPFLPKELREEQGPYAGNDAIGNISAEIEAGNKSGYEPEEFGNWLLNTSMDNKWEAISEPAKDFLMEKIAMPVADGHVSYDDLEVYVSENSALAKEDVESFGTFNEEELDEIFVEGKELRFLVSYELQFDGQIGESFKIKAKKKKKKLDEVDNIDYFVKSVEGENGPFASREAAANYITQQVLAGKNEADFEIITNNGEEEMKENQEAPKLVNESYKVYNTLGAETVGENTFNSWEEVDKFLQQEWGTYKASMINENPEFGTEEDKDAFLGNYDVEIIEVPVEVIDVCPECGQEPCICEPAETCVCPECGCEPCECGQAIEVIEEPVLEQPVDVVESEEETAPEETEESEEEQEEEKEEIVTPEEAAEVIDKVEDAIDSLEDFINMLVDDEELTQEEQDEIEALDLPAVVEQPEETPVDESLEDYDDPQGQITLKDAKKQFEKLVAEAHDKYWQGYKFIDITLLETHCPAFHNISWEDIPELIRSWGYAVLEDFGEEEPAIALGKEFTEDDIKKMVYDFNKENGFYESVKPEPPVQDDKNEAFTDGMLTDVKDLDMPDAIAQSIDVNDDGTVMRLKDVMEEVKALKAEMEKALADFKVDMKDVLNAVKQDIQRDVNDVETKVDDTQDAVDDLAVEEEEVEEQEVEEEPTEEQPEEQPEEAEEETEEQEEVKEEYKPTGNLVIDTTAQLLQEGNISLQGIYRKLSAKGINKTPMVTTLVENYITSNKLTSKLIKEEDDPSVVVETEFGEVRSKNPLIKKFCSKGVLEDLVDAKKKADEVIAQGGSAEDVKNAIDMYADNEQEQKQAKDYAINKMKESLLNTKKTSKLSIRGILD